jgi:4-oxalocrotonate tautomerase
MPIVTLEMGPLSVEQKEKLINAFSRDVCEVTGMPPEAMVVLIHELSRDNMGVGGQQLSKMNHGGSERGGTVDGQTHQRHH